MGLSVNSISTGVGIKTNYGNFNYGKVEQAAKKAVEDLQNRHNVTGQFLKWVELPKEQLKRVDYIYETVNALKNQSNAKFLSVIGIGGSKHPVEHMLSINGLNLDQSVKFMSDVDSTSHNRFMNSIGGDTRNSNFLIVSKSGTTFEPQDAFIRTKNMMEDAFVKEDLNFDNMYNMGYRLVDSKGNIYLPPGYETEDGTAATEDNFGTDTKDLGGQIYVAADATPYMESPELLQHMIMNGLLFVYNTNEGGSTEPLSMSTLQADTEIEYVLDTSDDAQAQSE